MPLHSDPQEELCKKIALDVRNRRRAGERISDGEVLRSYPELFDRLKVHLDRIQQLEFAKQRSQKQNSSASFDDEPIFPAELPGPVPSQLTAADPLGDHLKLRGTLPPPSAILAVLNDDSSPAVSANGNSPPHPAPATGEAPTPVDVAGMPDPVDDSAMRVTYRLSSINEAEGTSVLNDSLVTLDTSRAIPYRPTVRPPMAILRLMADDLSCSIDYPLFGDRFLIGRVAGDLIISHDLWISGKHAEIQRRRNGGTYEWYLVDLKSTNGTFIRMEQATLKHNDELFVGQERYRFINRGQEIGLLHVTKSGGDFWRFRHREEQLGSNSRELKALVDDPFLEAVHATFKEATSGDWTVKDNASKNGIWFRIRKAKLFDHAEFQLGEQRFRLSVPASSSAAVSSGNKPFS